MVLLIARCLVVAACRLRGGGPPLLVPADRQLDPTGLDEVLERAWAAADEQGIHGQATTPFLLDFIRVATDGRSLDANTALYFNNIRLAAQIAAELTK